MPYRFATQDADYSDFAGGRVLYSLPGMPAFPVRLAREMFLRAWAALGSPQRLTLYDPTCGGAYHLSALGLLQGAQIEAIYASDVDERAVALAQRNLGLLAPAGLERREGEIRALLESYGKESHQAALRSVDVFRSRLQDAAPIPTQVFAADALDAEQMRRGLDSARVDLALADVPYGQHSAWQMAVGEDRPPLWRLLDALRGVLAAGALVAIAADKAQKPAHEGYARVEQFQVGKRRVTLLRVL